jgi:hypothetical protein|uniref:Uncharacterized protein n=1 Tax=uncultured Caudovirales phage TaxID=2100421 RepID=A0A6J5L1T8_9CAUD|nr:hypothetical protein UFOVP88_33 [uncultured Caudovirales phage]
MAAFLPVILSAIASGATSAGVSHYLNKGSSEERRSGDQGKLERYSNYDKRGEQVLRDIQRRAQKGGFNEGEGSYKSGSQYIKNLLKGGGIDEEEYQQFADPILRQFNQEIIPNIAEQFGGVNAQGSSAFQQALGASGADLSSRLGALRAQMSMHRKDQQLQGANLALNYAQAPNQQRYNFANLALSNPKYGYINQPPTQSGTQQFLNQLGGGLGQGVGQFGSSWIANKFGPGGTTTTPQYGQTSWGSNNL